MLLHASQLRQDTATTVDGRQWLESEGDYHKAAQR